VAIATQRLTPAQSARSTVVVRRSEGKPLRWKLPVVVLTAAILAGGFSLGRFDLSFLQFGALQEARFWLFLALLLFAMMPGMAARSTTTGGRAVRQWVWAVLLFHAYVVLSGLWSPNAAYANGMMVPLGVCMGLVLIAPRFLRDDPERNIRLVFTIIFCVSVLFIADALYRGGSQPEDGLWVGEIGLYRLIGAGVLSATYLWAKTGNLRWLLVIPGMFMVAVFLVKGERASLAAFALLYPFALLLLIRRQRHPWARVAAWVGVVVIALTVGVLLIENVSESFARLWASFLVSPTEQFSLDNIYLADRDRLVADSWRMFLQHPLAGSGLGGFGNGVEDYPHNLLMNVLAEGGLIGLSLFAAPFLLLLGRWRKPRGLEHDTALITGAYFGATNLFHGTYTDALPMWLVLLLFMLPASGASDASRNLVGQFRQRADLLTQQRSR
jgi:O-antigen ligase